MGIGLWGLSPLCEIGISRMSVYQMTTSRKQSIRIRHGKSRKGLWNMAETIASGVGMTNDWLASQGVLSLKTLWAELAYLRRTAAALLCVEPTRPDPHARWCGKGARKRASLPDFSYLFLHLTTILVAVVAILSPFGFHWRSALRAPRSVRRLPSP